MPRPVSKWIEAAASPSVVVDRLRQHGQQRLADWFLQADPHDQASLSQQLQGIDLHGLAQWHRQHQRPTVQLDPAQLSPMEMSATIADDHARAVGLEALRSRRVAAITVAGGQGTRLHFPHPKGMFPIGPVQQTSLYQILAEKIRAWSQRAGYAIPWRIMTSETTHDATIAYFAERRHFGLQPGQVRFFQQGQMPAVDFEGQLLLASPSSLCLSPNGHGGVIAGLADAGFLDDFATDGIDILSYFQVDNPLVAAIDPIFIGRHVLTQSQFSIKVVRKQEPAEKVGLVVRHQGVPMIVEYSDLSRGDDLVAVRDSRDAAGRLRFWAGNTAIHLLDRQLLQSIAASGGSLLPFHTAAKIVPCLGPHGELVTPTEPNALKFEQFLFDALPIAKRVIVMEVQRSEEFVPLKNADGADSPAVVRSALRQQARDWLARAGAAVPDEVEWELEVSPLFALDADEFVQRWRQDRRVTGPTYFGPEAIG